MSRKDYEFTFVSDQRQSKTTAPEQDQHGFDNAVPNLHILDKRSLPSPVQPAAAKPEPTPRSRLAELRRLSEFIKLQRKLEALKGKDHKTR